MNAKNAPETHPSIKPTGTRPGGPRTPRGKATETDSFWGSFLSDPWRKAASVGLGFLLWLFLDSQVRRSIMVELRLESIDVSISVARERSGDTLDFRFPSMDFTVLRFEDSTKQEEARQITLSLSGPSHQIQRIDENPIFYIEPPVNELANGYEFDVRDIRAHNPDHQSLIDDMKPRRIKVVMEPNAEKEFVLSVGNVTFDMDLTREPNFKDRIEEEKIRFIPNLIKLHGTATSLDTLNPASPIFHADLRRYAKSGNLEARVRLVLRDDLKNIRVDPEAPFADITLRPDYVLFDLQLPVTLSHANPADKGKWETQQEMVGFKLNAAGAVENELSSKDPAAQQQWIERNALLYAVVPANADPKETPVPAILKFHNPDYQEGKDYRFEQPQVYIRPKGEK